VPTPANELLQRLAVRAAAAKEPPGQHDAAELLAAIGQAGQVGQAGQPSEA